MRHLYRTVRARERRRDDREVYALFRDPAGNILGIYQQAGLAEIEAQQAVR